VLVAVAGVLVKFLPIWVAGHWFDGLSVALCHWDCFWYVHTATVGYDLQPWGNPPSEDAADWAFFPLYAIAMRAVHAVSGLSIVKSGILVSVLCFTGFLIASLEYRRITRPGSGQLGWIAFALTFPFTFYFFVPYSESLYAFIATLVLIGIVAHRPSLTGISGALLSATRPTGILLMPCIAVERGLAAWRRVRAMRRRLSALEAASVLGDVLLPLAMVPLGLMTFMAYLYLRTGDALAFIHVQVAWNRHFSSPLAMLALGYHQWDWYRVSTSTSTSYGTAAALVGFAVAGYLALRRRWMEAYFCTASLLLAISTGLDSIPRYLIGNPAFLFAVYDLVGWLGPRFRAVVLTLFALTQAWLVWLWFGNVNILV
jgi:hypothetical protein